VGNVFAAVVVQMLLELSSSENSSQVTNASALTRSAAAEYFFELLAKSIIRSVGSSLLDFLKSSTKAVIAIRERRHFELLIMRKDDGTVAGNDASHLVELTVNYLLDVSVGYFGKISA